MLKPHRPRNKVNDPTFIMKWGKFMRPDFLQTRSESFLRIREN